MMSKKDKENKQQSSQGKGQAAQGQQQMKSNAEGQAGTGQANQNIPLSPKGQQISQQVDEQIEQFEQQISSKSNPELKQLSQQLESVEREMLLEKIDNELQTIKETVIKPGDIASTAAAGSMAATAVQTQTPVDRPSDTTA